MPDNSRAACATAEAQTDSRFSQPWMDWLVENLLAGIGRDQLAKVLVARGFDPQYADRKIAEVAASPILRGAAKAYRTKRKIASITDIYGELYSRSGFEIERREIEPEEFYRDYFFLNRPVMLRGLMSGWPALEKWTPQFFSERFGEIEIEITQDREQDQRYEDNFAKHRRRVTMKRYVEMILEGGSSNDYYLVARNQTLNKAAFKSLEDDYITPPGLLDPRLGIDRFARLWFGPSGTLTPLHCDNRPILFGQVYGRKHIKLISPYFLRSLYNDRSCYSAVDLNQIDYERFPAMRNVPILDTMVEPGEFLFIPCGWWHWVRALEISISISFLNFYYNDPELLWRDATF